MFILNASVFFGLVWMAGEDSSSLIVLIGIFCSKYRKYPQISRTLSLATQILGKKFFERNPKWSL